MASDQTKTRSRTEKYTKTKKASSDKGKTSKRKKNRYAFWFLLIALIFITFIIGSMIGYGFLGKQDPLEVLNIKTWKHMYNLIFG